jgi:uncharacterized membrane protein
MNERRIHQFFEISVLLKGAHALIECIGGILLAVIDTGTIIRLVEILTQDELLEDRHDFIATHLRAAAETFTPSTQHFYAFYLLSHGLVKVFLVAGLLRDKLWAYPASLVVLGLFIVYQLYRYSYTGGVGLLALTAFDVVVIALIWHEWRVRRGLKTFTTRRQA